MSASPQPELLPVAVPICTLMPMRPLPRSSIRCLECGQEFTAITGVIPRCMDCERRDPTTVEERAVLRLRGWDAVLDRRADAGTGRDPAIAMRVDVPAEYRHAQPDQAVRTWCDEPARPLILTGDVGRGKTYQAAGALHVLAGRRLSGYAIQVACASLARADAMVITRYQAAIALCLDDLGSRLSPAAIATAFELIDHRVANRKPLIVTTNLTRANLAAIDDRIESRLASGRWLVISGQDRRRPVKPLPAQATP